MPAALPAEVKIRPWFRYSDVSSTSICGNLLAQGVGVAPVRRRDGAVEQAGRSEHEGAGADRRQPRAAPMGGSQLLDKADRDRDVGAFPAWRHDQVGLVDQIGPAVRQDAETAMGAQRPRFDRATGEAIPA